LTVPEKPAAPPPPRANWLGILLALAAGLGAFVALLFLTFGQALPIFVFGAGVFVLAVGHYFIWGWWLGPLIRREVESDERQRR
jgi:hypothetical protein